jgi:hypothetical protein
VAAKSKSQFKLMAAVANNPEFAKKVDIPQKVGKEFIEETPKGAFKKLRKKLKKK